MRKNIFAIFGILVVLLLSFGLISASDSNGVTLTINQSSLSNVSIGDKYSFVATVANANGTEDYHVVFGTSDWTWTGDAVTVADGITTSFTGELTISSSTPATKSIIAKFYNTSNTSEMFFQLTEPVSITYYSTAISGCTNASATNYNSAATVDDGSCTYASSTTNTLCELETYTENGDLEISDFDVSNKGSGDDDAWQYLDAIEVTVEIENTNRDDSISDVEVKMVIMDNKIENGGNDVTNDFNIKDDVQTSIGKLRDGDQELVTFNIDELPSDLDDGTYYMYIMAYESGNEEEQCVSESSKLGDDYYYKFTVESVDYEDSVVASPSSAEAQINTYCGQDNLEITFPVYNLGTDKEEKILVSIYNTEMKIDEYLVFDNLRNGKRDTASFFINIPSQLNKDKYDLKILVSFDWDSDKSEAEDTSYNEETSDKSIRLNILDCKAATPTITASLESATIMGENLVVKAIIKNNANLNDFVIAPMGFESWASLVSVTPGAATIASGNTQEVLITLSPTQPGAQTFKISVAVDGEIYNQPVSVRIQEEPGMFDSLGFSDTTFYLIAGIAALFILIFLVLIVKVARRPTRAAEF